MMLLYSFPYLDIGRLLTIFLSAFLAYGYSTIDLCWPGIGIKVLLSPDKPSEKRKRFESRPWKKEAR